MSSTFDLLAWASYQILIMRTVNLNKMLLEGIEIVLKVTLQ